VALDDLTFEEIQRRSRRQLSTLEPKSPSSQLAKSPRGSEALESQYCESGISGPESPNHHGSESTHSISKEEMEEEGEGSRRGEEGEEVLEEVVDEVDKLPSFYAEGEGGDTKPEATEFSPQGEGECSNKENSPMPENEELPEFTEELFNEWKSRLQLDVVLRLCHHLGAKVEEFCHDDDRNPAEIVNYMKQGTMVGLLPVPHPIIMRTYEPNRYTALWFTSYLWGVIFTRTQNFPLYDLSKIRLIEIHE